MAEQAAVPLDMSLLAPRTERLDVLAAEFFQMSWSDLEPQQKISVYGAAQMEQQVTALGVLVQFCAGSR